MTIEYNTVSEGDWEKLEPSNNKPPSKYDEVLEQIMRGKIVKIEVADGHERSGARRSIVQRARWRDIKVEFRFTDNTLAVRKVDDGTRQVELPEVGTVEADVHIGDNGESDSTRRHKGRKMAKV